MKTIVLTEKEIEVINGHLNGDFDHYTITKEQANIFNKVLNDADDFMRDEDLFDEIEDENFSDMIEWYYNKYLEQQQGN